MNEVMKEWIESLAETIFEGKGKRELCKAFGFIWATPEIIEGLKRKGHGNREMLVDTFLAMIEEKS